jgi:ATP-dependent DNA ligase
VQAKERLDQHRIEGPRPYYNTNERPSVWFEPTEVWELRGADLTLSAVHKSAFGLIHPTRGVSLR